MTAAAIVRAIDAEIWRAHEERASAGIRALTVRQPWASLIADGLKTIEVRTHRVSYRGLLIIHAGQTMAEYGYDPRAKESGDPLEYSMGTTAAIARLTGCRRLEPDDEQATCADPAWWPFAWEDPEAFDHVWGWVLADVAPLPHVPLRGRQGLWIPTRDELWVVRCAVSEATT